MKQSTSSKVTWLLSTGGKQLLWTLIPIVAVGAIWQIVATAKIIPAAFFPPLEKIFGAIFEMGANGTLWTDVGMSMYRLAISVVVGIIIGTSVGLVMGTSRIVERSLLPIMNFGLAVPGIALVPLAILIFGLSDLTLIAILIIEVIWVTMLNTWTAVKSVEQRYIDAARTMGTKGVEMFVKVLLPGALVGIIGGYRLAFSRGWRILVAGEMLTGVAGGLGYRIFEAREYFRSDIVYGGILIIGLFGLLLDRVILRSLEAATVERWGAVRKLK
ncbi:MAG: ABC transporter permease [Cryobacterium sp.]|nr:ABC transporter permease [Cryobacterium sp.]